jgi:two-component system chemotaxis response regulator CheB
MRMSDPSKRPTEFTCPDCIGVLLLEMDQGNHRGYICQVGHRFTTRSLLAAKEKEVEKTLWAAAALIGHIIDVNGRLLKELPRGDKERRRLERRIREARSQRSTLIRMVENTHAAG